jgi:hypothetical protein
MENFFDLSAIKLPEIKFYLYYDNNGNIIELLNYKKDSSNYVEVSEEFVTEFRESGKELHSYTLKIDDRPKVVKRLENIQIGQLFKVLTTDPNADFLICIHNSRIIFKIKNFDFYSNLAENFKHFFFIVDKNNLHFLKRTVIINHKDLEQGYEVDHFFDFNKEILLTRKYFESYGLVYE